MKVPEKIICDICGKQISKGICSFGFHRVQYFRSHGYKFPPLYRSKSTVDICDDCWKNMRDYLTEIMEKGEQDE